MVIPMLQNLQSRLNRDYSWLNSQHLKRCFSHRIEHVAALDLLLQVHLLLFPLIVLHDLQPEKMPFRSTDSTIDDLKPLLLHQSAFLNVELLLSLCIDLFSFFICFLKIGHQLIIVGQLWCVVNAAFCLVNTGKGHKYILNLFNEGHHMLDLFLHIAVGECHLQAFQYKL